MRFPTMWYVRPAKAQTSVTIALTAHLHRVHNYMRIWNKYYVLAHVFCFTFQVNQDYLRCEDFLIGDMCEGPSGKQAVGINNGTR